MAKNKNNTAPASETVETVAHGRSPATAAELSALMLAWEQADAAVTKAQEQADKLVAKAQAGLSDAAKAVHEALGGKRINYKGSMLTPIARRAKGAPDDSAPTMFYLRKDASTEVVTIK